MTPVEIITGLSLILQYAELAADAVQSIGALIQKAAQNTPYTTEEQSQIDALFEANHDAIQKM